VLRQARLAIAVADACPEVRRVAHYVTQAPGGRGAVREAIELILRSLGAWQGVAQRFAQGESGA
jgi:3-deoxy-D-manno-octulosonate 8-phosphate phosphatase (KDO 8-P phosphatase)